MTMTSQLWVGTMTPNKTKISRENNSKANSKKRTSKWKINNSNNLEKTMKNKTAKMRCRKNRIRRTSKIK